MRKAGRADQFAVSPSADGDAGRRGYPAIAVMALVISASLLWIAGWIAGLPGAAIWPVVLMAFWSLVFAGLAVRTMAHVLSPVLADWHPQTPVQASRR